MLEMKPEVRKDFCKALRSGEYAQGHGALREVDIGEDGTTCDVYCCLGVLTDLYVKAGNPETFRSQDGCELSVWGNGVLETPVIEWASLENCNPVLSDGQTAVTHNDSMSDSFDTIADFVDDGEGRRV